MNEIKRVNHGLSANKNKLSKSKLPDSIRQKIPPFKPKKLQEIFQDSKCKRSTDSNEKIMSCTDKFPNFQLKQSQEDELRFSSPANLQKTKNKLVDFMKDCDNSFEIESVELQDSQIDNKIKNVCQFNGFHSQERNPTKKLQFRVFTPQSENNSKKKQQIDQLIFKDEPLISRAENVKTTKIWNGEITMATSMYEDEFENQLLNCRDDIPQQLRMFIDDRNYYAFCRNQKTQNELLLESALPLNWAQIRKRLVDMERNLGKSKVRVGKKEKQQFRIKVVEIQQLDQYLVRNFSEQQLQKHLNTQVFPQTKYLSITYRVQFSFRPRDYK